MSYSWLALNYLIDEELYFAFSFLVRKTGRAQSYPLKSRYCWLAMGIPHICHFFYTSKIFGE